MAVIGSTWVIILRCHSCKALFTVKGILGHEIGQTADSSKCPHCGANGDALRTLGTKRHLIEKLTRESDDS
jgi:rRNA maturation endonuclease Nob1